MYRARNKGMQILLSNSQAGLGRTVKQEQEEISRNHVQAFIPGRLCNHGCGLLCGILTEKITRLKQMSRKCQKYVCTFVSLQRRNLLSN